MTQTVTINANHPDYWSMLKAAYRDISFVLQNENVSGLLPRGCGEKCPEIGEVYDHDYAWRAYDKTQEMLAASPLLARLHSSISGWEWNRYI